MPTGRLIILELVKQWHDPTACDIHRRNRSKVCATAATPTAASASYPATNQAFQLVPDLLHQRKAIGPLVFVHAGISCNARQNPP